MLKLNGMILKFPSPLPKLLQLHFLHQVTNENNYINNYINYIKLYVEFKMMPDRLDLSLRPTAEPVECEQKP